MGEIDKVFYDPKAEQSILLISQYIAEKEYIKLLVAI